MYGIDFDSKLELYTYELFKDVCNIERITEPFILLDKFEIWDLEKGKIKKYRDLKYTPDFIIHDWIEKPIIIECKGFASRDFPLRLKMFLNKYGDDYYYLQIKSQKHCREVLEKLMSIKED